ncbi:MAG: MurNAc alpha-1-phosphate uridylyltransferase [Ascidiaceihabitans sp.]|jgi:MurNAc alpha-1-phosphate uridylyltransferase
MRDHPTSVMLFAAGFGTRMKHLTADLPKPLVQVAGRALIDHTLDSAREINPDVIVANLHYLPHMIVAHLADTDVHTITESPEILDTGGGLRNALPILGNAPVVTMNTDAIWSGPNPAKLAMDAWQPDKMDALLVCIPIQQTVGYQRGGDFSMSPDGHIKRGPDLVYGGVQIIKTDRLAAIPDKAFSLNVLWDQMLAEGRLFGLPYPGRWCDVGHPGGISQAEALLNV